MERKEHGEPGHLNVYKRDQESIITGYGKHHRVVAFLPGADGLYCRVDHKHGEREPTPAEVLAVARKVQGVRGRWVLYRIDRWEDGSASDYLYTRKG